MKIRVNIFEIFFENTIFFPKNYSYYLSKYCVTYAFKPTLFLQKTSTISITCTSDPLVVVAAHHFELHHDVSLPSPRDQPQALGRDRLPEDRLLVRNLIVKSLEYLVIEPFFLYKFSDVIVYTLSI